VKIVYTGLVRGGIPVAENDRHSCAPKFGEYEEDQKVDFFDKNNKWETFQNPSEYKKFTDVVNNKL
jgi:hypothetical protein